MCVYKIFFRITIKSSPEYDNRVCGRIQNCSFCHLCSSVPFIVRKVEKLHNNKEMTQIFVKFLVCACLFWDNIRNYHGHIPIQYKIHGLWPIFIALCENAAEKKLTKDVVIFFTLYAEWLGNDNLASRGFVCVFTDRWDSFIVCLTINMIFKESQNQFHL